METSKNWYNWFIIRILCWKCWSKSARKFSSNATWTSVNKKTEIIKKHHQRPSFFSDYYNDLENSKQLIPLTNLAIGDFGVAKYSDDNRWYRARLITCEEHDSIKIVFVDFGNIEIKSINDFYPLHKLFTDLPAQAIACSLSEVRRHNKIRKYQISFFLGFSSNTKWKWNHMAGRNNSNI
jgi:hypothetical protein